MARKPTKDSRYTVDVAFTDKSQPKLQMVGSFAEIMFNLGALFVDEEKTVSSIQIGRVIAEGTIGELIRHD